MSTIAILYPGQMGRAFAALLHCCGRLAMKRSVRWVAVARKPKNRHGRSG